MSTMSFEPGPIEEVDSFERNDLSQHRAYLSDLVRAWQSAGDKVAVGQATVITGEILESGPSKGRGKEELADERGFRKVATEMGVGLRVTHRHVADGKTLLRLAPQQKKEFSAEAIAKRTAALDKRRDRLAVEKYAKEHNKHVNQLTPAEAQGAVKANRERIAASRAGAPKAPVAKKPAS